MKKLTDFLSKRPLLWFALTLALSIVIVFLLQCMIEVKQHRATILLVEKLKITRIKLESKGQGLKRCKNLQSRTKGNQRYFTGRFKDRFSERFFSK